MRRHKGALALVLLLALAVAGASGCGNSLSKEASEGEPIQLGDLKYNVQETRYLNQSQPDDKEYLAGQQLPTPPGKLYLGVFLTIHNSGDNPVRVPANAGMSVVDTTGAAYQSIPSHTDFAAPLGSLLPPGGDIPGAGTAAANGPTQGALVLFLVNQNLTENRPPKLEIDSQGETGEITLDL